MEYHHWDRDGELQSEASRSTRNTIVRFLFGEPPLKESIGFLELILEDAKEKKAKRETL